MRWAQISDKISRFNKKRRRIWQWGVFWFQIRPWLNQQKVLDWSFWGVRVVTVKKGHEKIRADMENEISTLIVIRSLILEGWSYKLLLRGLLGKSSLWKLQSIPSQAWFCLTWEIWKEMALRRNIAWRGMWGHSHYLSRGNVLQEKLMGHLIIHHDHETSAQGISHKKGTN